MGDGADFQTGVFSCFSDKTLCLMSFMFPNYVFGRIAEVVLMEGENYYTGVLKYKVSPTQSRLDSYHFLVAILDLCFEIEMLKEPLSLWSTSAKLISRFMNK